MYYDFIHQHKRKFFIGVVLFIILVAIWGITTFVNRQGKVAVFINTVPSDAEIVFNNTRENNGTKWMKPGDYTVTAKKDGFTAVTRKVRITDLKTQNVVAISLHAESDEAKKWAADHVLEYQKNEAYGTIEANTNGEYFSNLNPITTKLPFVDPYFKIAYVTNDDQSITLTVTTPSPRYRFYAVEKIREFGYDPTDFVIEFKDFKNPLEVK